MFETRHAPLLGAVVLLALAAIGLAVFLLSGAEDGPIDGGGVERFSQDEDGSEVEPAGLQPPSRPAQPSPPPPPGPQGKEPDGSDRDETTEKDPEAWMGRAYRHFRAKEWSKGLDALRRAVDLTRDAHHLDERRLWLVVALLERGPAEEALHAWLSLVEDANRMAGPPDPEYHFYRRSFFLNKLRLSDDAKRTWSLNITLGKRFNTLGRKTGEMNAYLTSRVKSQLVDVLARDRPESTDLAQAVAFHRFLEVNYAMGVVSNEPDLDSICASGRAFIEEYKDSDGAGIQAMVAYLEKMLPECWKSR